MTKEEFSFTTRIRFIINRLLSPVGVQVSTSAREEKEINYLRTLQEKGHWNEGKYLKGLNLNDDKFLMFLDDICLPFKNDFGKFSNSNRSELNDYTLNNEFFSSFDAEVLYSIIRFLKPQNIFEVGSGFSTRLMKLAIIDGDLPTRIVCIDPRPRTDILGSADEHYALNLENMPVEIISGRIKEGDILFIDSSHIVSTGSDVNYFFLEVLPDLPVGVWVHIHDIYFPFDYPEEWVINKRWGWNEQYLVHAFLMFNDAFEIVWPAHYMLTNHVQKIREVFQGIENNYKPSSLWIKKVK